MKSNHKFTRVLAVAFAASLFVVFFFGTFQSTHAEKSLYTGKEHHEVNFESAQRWTGRFQLDAKPGDIMAGYMAQNIFKKILEQPGCVGIRIYNAKLDNGQPTFVLVGVDGDGNDMVGGAIGEDIIPCPPMCPLNSLFESKKAIALAR